MRFKLKSKKLPLPTQEDKDPKVAAIEDAVAKSRIAKAAAADFESAKDNLKNNIFPYGTPNGEGTWTFGFEPGHPMYPVTVQYQERTKPYLDIDAATKILKEKRLYTKCLTTPEPPPPPQPFLDEEKIHQFLSEGKLTQADIRKMIKVSKKDTTKVIVIREPEAKRGKPHTNKKTKTK